jgi:two-component system, cell cycle response regulator
MFAPRSTISDRRSALRSARDLANDAAARAQPRRRAEPRQRPDPPSGKAADARAWRILQEESTVTDELTGLYNRRYLLARLDELLERVRQDATSVAILLLDIDHFKRLNDTYGHAAGNDVLRELAVRTMKSVQSGDLVARLGGEEFVVVMPETDITIATAVAERLRLAIAKEPFVVRASGEKLAVMISIGVTRTGGIRDNRGWVLNRAEEALYTAKSGGRNRVVVLPPE